MGWYLRKSLKIGPLRVNLSRSGVGGSVGVKGLRVGTGPRGSYLHAGREGLYYRTRIGEPASGSEPAAEPLAEEAEAPDVIPANADKNRLGVRLLRALFGGRSRGR